MTRSAAPVAGFWHSRVGVQPLPPDLARVLLLLRRGRLLRSILGRRYGSAVRSAGATPVTAARAAAPESAHDAER